MTQSIRTPKVSSTQIAAALMGTIFGALITMSVSAQGIEYTPGAIGPGVSIQSVECQDDEIVGQLHSEYLREMADDWGVAGHIACVVHLDVEFEVLPSDLLTGVAGAR